jgi:hypothetical protein
MPLPHRALPTLAARTIVDELFVAALGHVVEVLNADNLGDGLRLGQLPGRDCAEADVVNETLVLEFSERGVGVVPIERIRSNTFTDCADNHIVRYDRADMAVLAVAAADFIGRGNKASPNRSGRSLRDCLPLERSLAFRRQLLVHLIDHLLELSRVHSRVDGCRTDAASAMPLVEGNREEDVGCLGPAVSDERGGWMRR